jgi:hypothetical protein
MSEEERLQGIRDIDGNRINKLVETAIGAFEALLERGIVVTLFGFPIPIRLGPWQPIKDESE